MNDIYARLELIAQYENALRFAQGNLIYLQTKVDSRKAEIKLYEAEIARLKAIQAGGKHEQSEAAPIHVAA